MKAEHSDWKNGWYGVSLGIGIDEIDHLIKMLEMIRNDPEQHFHVSSDYQGNGGVGDIEVFVLPQESSHNMTISGKAMPPGKVDSIDVQVQP